VCCVVCIQIVMGPSRHMTFYAFAFNAASELASHSCFVCFSGGLLVYAFRSPFSQPACLSLIHLQSSWTSRMEEILMAPGIGYAVLLEPTVILHILDHLVHCAGYRLFVFPLRRHLLRKNECVRGCVNARLLLIAARK